MSREQQKQFSACRSPKAGPPRPPISLSYPAETGGSTQMRRYPRVGPDSHKVLGARCKSS